MHLKLLSPNGWRARVHYIGFKALEKITEHYWWQKAFQREYGGGGGEYRFVKHRFVTLVLLVSQSGAASTERKLFTSPVSEILGEGSGSCFEASTLSIPTDVLFTQLSAQQAGEGRDTASGSLGLSYQFSGDIP